jgi:hypothetical protein
MSELKDLMNDILHKVVEQNDYNKSNDNNKSDGNNSNIDHLIKIQIKHCEEQKKDLTNKHTEKCNEEKRQIANNNTTAIKTLMQENKKYKKYINDINDIKKDCEDKYSALFNNYNQLQFLTNTKDDEKKKEFNNLKNEIEKLEREKKVCEEKYINLQTSLNVNEYIKKENISLRYELANIKKRLNILSSQNMDNLNIIKQLQEEIKNAPKKNCDAENAEIKKLREEINQLKKSSSSQNNSNNSNPPTNNIIMVNKPSIVYENDDRFSDYIFRNPRAEKNTYVKENVGEFLNKLFNSDDK